MPTDVDATLARIAAHRLVVDGALADSGPIELGPDTWPAVAPTLVHQRLTGLAASAVTAGALRLDEEQQAQLAEDDQRVQVQALRAERLTLELCAELEGAGIPHRVLKGAAYAHGWYPDPALRPFIDVDLLVPGDALGEVVERCTARGATRRVPELRGGFDSRFAKSVTLLHRSPMVEIDLHRTLSLGPLTHLVAIDDLWGAPSTVAVTPERMIPALDADVAFVHACLHIATDRRRTRWLTLRDLVETGGAADLSRCTDLAARWRATAVVQAAVDAVVDRGLPVPAALAAWSAALSPTAAEQALAAEYARKPSARAMALAGFRHVPGLRAKLAYAWAMTVPDRANRRARRRSLRSQARRLLGGST